MIDSVHTVRWIENSRPSDCVEFIVVPAGPHRKPHPDLASQLAPNGPIREIKAAGILGGLVSYALDKYLGTSFQSMVLNRTMSQLDESSYSLHYLEMQHSGYLAMKSLRRRSAPIVIGTNWGSDLVWFGKLGSHRRKIELVLRRTNRYLVECKRDYKLAAELGFRGEQITIGPNSFSFRPRLTVRKEPLILVKGYESWAGISHTALRALARARRASAGYKVIVYSASLRTRIYCSLLKIVFRLDIAGYRKHKFNQAQMRDLFARSAIYIGASRTDGISTSALEAMNQGALPIQTQTACLEDLKSLGAVLLTPSPTEDSIYRAIISALQMVSGPKDYIKKNEDAVRVFGSSIVARRRFELAYGLGKRFDDVSHTGLS